MQTLTRRTIAVCAVFFLLVSCPTASHSQTASSQIRRHAANDVGLVIDYGNSTQQAFTGLSGTTVFDVLNETAYLAYTTYAFGRFIESINGVGNNAGGNGCYWQYWVNDQLAPVAADYYVLSDGDDILWKYCAPGQTGSGALQGMPDWRIGLLVIVVVGCALVAVTALITRKSR